MQDREVEITLALIGIIIGVGAFFVGVVTALVQISLASNAQYTTPFKVSIYAIVIGICFAIPGTLYYRSKKDSTTNNNSSIQQENVQINSNTNRRNIPNPRPTVTPHVTPVPSPIPNQPHISEGIPFRIVLNEYAYCFKGVIAGVYNVSPSSVDINITKPDIKLCLDSPHPQRTLVSFRIGVAAKRYADPSTDVRWGSFNTVNKVMIAGSGYSLNPRRFSIEQSDRQLSHVIVIEIGFTWSGRKKPLYVFANS